MRGLQKTASPHLRQRFACYHARLIGNGFRLISDNSVRLLPGIAYIIINTMGSLCDTLHPLNKASLFIELISCLLGQTATSLSINLKDWRPSTALSLLASMMMRCQSWLAHSGVENIMKTLIDLSVAGVRWEPFSKFIRLLRHLERKEMSVELYVGNLTFNTTEQYLQEQFSRYGQVSSASVITDLDTDRSRGFAFVELDSQESAQAAIDALNGKELNGRALAVKGQARDDHNNRGGFRGGCSNFGSDSSRRRF
jgi:cold-inducible RNA-binding protein